MTGKITVSLGRKTVQEIDRRVSERDSTRSFEVRTAIRLTMPSTAAERILRHRLFAVAAGDEPEAQQVLTEILKETR